MSVRSGERGPFARKIHSGNVAASRNLLLYGLKMGARRTDFFMAISNLLYLFILRGSVCMEEFCGIFESCTLIDSGYRSTECNVCILCFAI